jgi:hypothetical protein
LGKEVIEEICLAIAFAKVTYSITLSRETLNLTESIAWPLTVFALVFLIKEPLKSLIPLMESFSFKYKEIFIYLNS